MKKIKCKQVCPLTLNNFHLEIYNYFLKTKSRSVQSDFSFVSDENLKNSACLPVNSFRAGSATVS